MKFNIKYKSTLMIILLGLLVTSCEKALDEQKPQASLDAGTAFVDGPSVNAGINGVYSGLQSGNYYGLRYQIMADLGADNLSHVGTFPSFSQIFNKSILPDNAEVVNMYNSIYANINNANTLIEAIPTVTDPTLNKDNALAPLRTMRALMYFDLIRYWGGSPDGYAKAGGVGVSLKLTATKSEADAVPIARSTEAQVYTQILADIDFALGVTTFTDRVANRVGKDVARALKARVQLYREQFDDAEALATTLILSGRYPLVSNSNYFNLWFLKNQSEAIFELDFNTADQNNIAFFYYPSNRGGRNEISSSAGLNTAHEANDVRKPINFTTTVPTAKTAKATRVGTGDDNVIIFRSSEMYLIRAEARLRKPTPNFPGALSDLNEIRRRAGLTDFVSLAPADLLNAILRERRVEFAHEGHRLFDLRRLNRVSILGISQPFRALWPIPQREVLTSGGIITQNTGY